VLVDEVLYRLHTAKALGGHEGLMRQLVVPAPLRTTLMSLVHDDPLCGGHLNAEKGYQMLQLRYWWPRMHKNMISHGVECPECATAKGLKGNAPIAPIPLPRRPYELCGIDFMGPFPSTHGKNKYVLVISDYLTRWVEAFAVEEATAEVAAEKMWEVI
jgi:hypothetical protein